MGANVVVLDFLGVLDICLVVEFLLFGRCVPLKHFFRSPLFFEGLSSTLLQWGFGAFLLWWCVLLETTTFTGV